MPPIEAIPEELRALPQWVTWRFEQRGTSKPTKVPYSPATGTLAGSTDPTTWASFEKAYEVLGASNGRYDGIGFCFSPTDPYCGVDLDDCIAPTGETYPKAMSMIGKLGSYTEVSPSGTGLKTILRAKKPGDRCKAPIEWADGAKGQIEMYDSARYFTITGRIIPDAPIDIQDGQPQLTRLYNYLFTKPEPRQHAAVTRTPPMERCWKYLEKCPDSISGQNGHDKAFRAACECYRFGLSDQEAADIMQRWSASKSDEPWSAREMAHKLKSAHDKCSAAGEVGIRLRSENWKEPPAPVKIEPPPAGSVGHLNTLLGRIKTGEYAAAPWKWNLVGKLTQALLPGAVTMLCGTPGAGKTFFVLDAALGWLEMGIPFKLFELEEDRTYYLRRAMAMLDECSDMTELAWIKANTARVQAASAKHATTLNKLGECIYDSPCKRVSLMQVADWYESVAGECRVVVIDPITSAAAGKDRYVEDGAFMERVKTIALQSETSLVLVTHPKLGNRKGPPTLDDMAGSADFPRFCQTVMVLSACDPMEPVTCRTAFGRIQASPNRLVTLRKTRNGRGENSAIAFDFNQDSLNFVEKGVVIDE